MAMPANPIACSYCGGRYGHMMWCQRPTPTDKWNESMALIDALVETVPSGKERGKLRSKLMTLMREAVRTGEDDAAQAEFAELMYAHGYHRPW